jgi:hypothetical protein
MSCETKIRPRLIGMYGSCVRFLANIQSINDYQVILLTADTRAVHPYEHNT